MALSDKEVFELLEVLKKGLAEESEFKLTGIKVILPDGRFFEENLEEETPRVVH
jgi:hypothetical protein